jgi:outer membrane protein TolC
VVDAADFARRVREHHPVVRQAALRVEQAAAERRAAQGAFDPQLAASWTSKRFGGADYYDYREAKLTLPTRLGLDVEVGYERTSGRYFAADRRTPDRGLLTAGVVLPIGGRLVADERRTALAVADALRDAAAEERALAANATLAGAARAYAAWWEARRRVGVAAEGVALAEFRLTAVRGRVQAGEAAPVDTVEARLEVQRRVVQRVEAEQAQLAARLAAEAYLWDERGAPVALPAGAVPRVEEAAVPPPDSAAAARLLAEALDAHPEVRRLEARLAGAVAQRRLAAAGLVPSASARLGSLAAADAGLPFDAAPPSAGGKVGLAASSSLLLRRERGRLAAATLAVEQQRLDLARARRDVAVRVRQAAAELDALAETLALQEAAVGQARQLRDAEVRRFEGGESTLFLVNARDRAVLDEMLRLAALQARRVAAGAELRAAAGLLPELR